MKNKFSISTMPASKNRTFRGIPSSHGFAIGTAQVLMPGIRTDYHLTFSSSQDESSRLRNALSKTANFYHEILDKARELNDDNAVAIIEANLMIIEDSFFLTPIFKEIENGLPAEHAVSEAFENQMNIIRRYNKSITDSRLTELESIREKILNILLNTDTYNILCVGAIIVAKRVSAEDVILFKASGISAIITEEGGISSHAAILARAFEIPSVIGITGLTNHVTTDTPVIVDGYEGVVIIDPDDRTIELYDRNKVEEEKHKQILREITLLPSCTIDGRMIKLGANIDIPQEIDVALKNNSDGCGLVRTEYLINAYGRMPDEEEQTYYYSDIAAKIFPNTVTLRAFDIGADKPVNDIDRHDSNPALGLRGIRYLLKYPEIFKTQLTAILRASAKRNLRLMLPMVTNIEEIEETLSCLKKCKTELAAAHKEFDPDLPVGIMIETPSAALLAADFAKYVKFFSIGTNDLTQYTLAADRTNESVNTLFDTFNPAVLRLINTTVEAAKANEISVAVCGEFAANELALPFLVGIGVDELSMAPTVLMEIKSFIRNLDYSECKYLAKQVLECSSANTVRKLLYSIKEKNIEQYFTYDHLIYNLEKQVVNNEQFGVSS
jgi:phosphotransferase system enzyme I (PtsI)